LESLSPLIIVLLRVFHRLPNTITPLYAHKPLNVASIGDFDQIIQSGVR
jgi:hypothetical protein